ncbi:recombinase family protein [Actinoplanes solisilvae]|uniref:recombinase family protein n=1 Tax=Actinoplanes solisilvae TaxID=2486853 RepID=UPI000FD9F614|nr:recombinase family protein [Actinoplanes solisilvae]
MNLREWAAATGVSYATARRRYESGTLPVPAYRLGRLIMVREPVTGLTNDAGQIVVYARVSSADQKPDLDRQVARVTVWATGQKLGVDRVVTEILTSLCARLYGRRAAANRARRAVEAATEDPR